MIRIALSSEAYAGSDTSSLIQAAKAAGVQGIEWADTVFDQSGDTAKAVATMIETLNAGLSTVSYSVDKVWSGQAIQKGQKHGAMELKASGTGLLDRQACQSALETTRELNAPILRLGPIPDAVHKATATLQFVDDARFIADEAGKLGITLCFTPTSYPSLESYQLSAGLLSAIEHPFVKLAWETPPDADYDEAMDVFADLAGLVGLFMVRAEAVLPDGHDRSEEWLQFLDTYDEQGGSPDMARHVIIRSMEGCNLADLASITGNLASWGLTLRRYHRRRVY